MPSYSWSNRFREGQWRAYRKFLLEERGDASSRGLTISAELERIGDIGIGWVVDSEGNPTEERGAFTVDPGTSLGKLVQAYAALGGNPFDISAFASPDSALVVDAGTADESIVQTQPHGGLVAPLDIKYVLDNKVNARDVTFIKYRTSRLGGVTIHAREDSIADRIYRSRKWITQEIRFKRVRIEERIIKLADLREQLETELSDMVWAMNGELPGVDWNPERYNSSLCAGYIAYYIDGIFRIKEEDGTVNFDAVASVGDPGAPNSGTLGDYPNLMSDLPEEKGTAC